MAFSVLYESDEYLNFMAPDKHEVRTRAAVIGTPKIRRRRILFEGAFLDTQGNTIKEEINKL